jgi:tetratricopeptide (TPR) repeat protein
MTEPSHEEAVRLISRLQESFVHLRTTTAEAKVWLARLREQVLNQPGKTFLFSDANLAALSYLCNQLQHVKKPSLEVIDEARIAYGALSGTRSPDDEFGEVSEILSTLCFLGWRHARALNHEREAHEWLELFDRHYRAPSVARKCVEYFLATSATERSEDLNGTFLMDGLGLFALCSLLRERRNSSPATLHEQVYALREWVEERFWPVDFQDERDYFLGQMELALASSSRWLGEHAMSLAWLETAERRVVGRGRESMRAEVNLVRLMVVNDRHDAKSVLSAIPAIQERLQSLGMATALAKTELLRGSALRALGKLAEATAVIEAALQSDAISRMPHLRAFGLEQLADCHALSGRVQDCAAALGEAERLFGEGSATFAGAGYRRMIAGEALVVAGDLEGAVGEYREGTKAYDALGMEAFAAYSRILTAEILIALGREGEARSEILGALPAIEKLKLVPEGVAAWALLRKSLDHASMDRRALRELGPYLRPK